MASATSTPPAPKASMPKEPAAGVWLSEPTIVCTPKFLPREKWVEAAQKAVEINPVNHPPVEHLLRAIPNFKPTPERIAVLTSS